MKILVSSDHHHHPFPAFARVLKNGITSRLAEGLAVEDFLLDLAKKEEVKIHLRCGDLFHQKNTIDGVTLAELTWRFERWQKASIQQVFLAGNHDEAAGGLRHTIEGLDPHGVIVTRPRIAVRGEGAVIHAIPYCNPKEAADYVQESGHSSDDSILIIHASINGSKTGSEFVVPGIDLADLMPHSWKYIFTGHVHEPQNLRDNVFTVGSLLQRSHADEGRGRRALIFDLDWNYVREIALPGPRFKTVSFHTPDELDTFAPDCNTYYKVVLTSPKVTDEVADARFDSQCLGWTLGRTAEANLFASEGEPRIGHNFTRWEDITAEYLKSFTDTPMPPSELMETAKEIISEVSP